MQYVHRAEYLRASCACVGLQLIVFSVFSAAENRVCVCVWWFSVLSFLRISLLSVLRRFIKNIKK